MNAPFRIISGGLACIDVLQTKKDGTPKASLHNARLILLDDPEWQGVISLDEFAQQVVARKKHPGRGTVGAWSDIDDSAAALWIASNYKFDIPTRLVAEAVALVAEQNKFHPVREYLENLKWDGKERVQHLLPFYFGAKDTDYSKLVGIKFMVSAVARIFEPGCKVDNVMILEGLQGAGKSTALSILGGDWYMDTAINIGDKDSFQVMRGKWIIELGELDSLRKSEASRVKQFLTAATDTYRESYARRSADFKRRCIFTGSTNQFQYLKDETGNRRFWPVECGELTLRYLREDRDQLWAEAVQLYRNKTPWWVSTKENNHFGPEQEERYQADAWEDIIEEFLNGKHEVTLNQVAIDALSFETSKIDRASQTRIGACMCRLGWKNYQVRQSGKRVRGIYRRVE